MIEQDIAIGAIDRGIDAVLFRPESDVPLPGVIHLTDIRGIREIRGEKGEPAPVSFA